MIKGLRAGESIDVSTVLCDLNEITKILLNEMCFVFGPDCLFNALVCAALAAYF